MSDSSSTSALKLSPLYDTSSVYGRFRHFAAITDPRLCLVPTHKLLEAKKLLHQHKAGQTEASPADRRKASILYQSAFHPDTGELQNFVGRMSFQVPGGMCLTGAMLAFYRSTPAVVFWQWANQSFNAFVNYTNRSAASDLTTSQIAMAYISATGAALVSALSLKKILTRSTKLVFMQRYVPFTAVAAANIVNIPLMRQSELVSGVQLTDEKGNPVVTSKVSAVKGISQVVLCRIVMAAPGMLLMPLIMKRVEKMRGYRPFLSLPLQVALCGVSLTLMVPLACSIFDQKCAIETSALQSAEPEVYAELLAKYDGTPPSRLYFNKGL